MAEDVIPEEPAPAPAVTGAKVNIDNVFTFSNGSIEKVTTVGDANTKL